MKTMTCKEMGGMCDTPISAQTSDEMIDNGMKHIVIAHPQMAKDIETMPKDDPKMIEWYQKFMKDWGETKETN